MSVVWVVEQHIPYEGFDIQGIYTSKEEAEKHAKAIEQSLIKDWEESIKSWKESGLDSSGLEDDIRMLKTGEWGDDCPMEWASVSEAELKDKYEDKHETQDR